MKISEFIKRDKRFAFICILIAVIHFITTMYIFHDVVILGNNEYLILKAFIIGTVTVTLLKILKLEIYRGFENEGNGSIKRKRK